MENSILAMEVKLSEQAELIKKVEMQAELLADANDDLSKQLTIHKNASYGLLKITHHFGMGCNSVEDIDVDDLLVFLGRIQNTAQNESVNVSNLRGQVQRLIAAMELLKSDMINLNHDYDFSNLGEFASKLDMQTFGDRFTRMQMHNSNHKLWQVISNNTRKVINNTLDQRTGLLESLKTSLVQFAATGETLELMQLLEASAEQLIDRGEV